MRTRERLLDAAERLWGERGVEGVSLREIRLAAGQRNSSALQFHFGNREGLRLALMHRHLPRISALQDTFYRGLVTEGRQNELPALVEAMIRPIAEYLRLGPSERAWIKIAAERLARPELTIDVMAEHAPAVGFHIGATVYAQLTDWLAPDVAVERIMAVISACHHLCADRARLEDVPPESRGRPGLSFDRWLANLLDMAVAAMTAPAR